MRYIKKICLRAGAALLGCALICGCGAQKEPVPTTSVTVPQATESRQPSSYTWEEYLAMTAEEQLEFQQKFGSKEVFEAWMENARKEDTAVECPWDEPGAKQPEDYTWEEFQALTGDQQIAFQNAMGMDSFEAWAEQARNKPQTNPWEEPGAKQPEDYTWEEFQALTGDQQIAFQNAMGVDAFEAWAEQAQGPAAAYPWEEPGAKQPEDYTWEEFQALTGEAQIAFQNALGQEAFEAWLEQSRSQTAAYPWEEPGGKRPEDYTWEEFEALSGEAQIAFQRDMGVEAFEAWMNRVSP